MKKVVVTMLLCLLPCLADADDFQCKNGIVSEGATRDEVLSKCGEPATKERFRVDGRRGHFKMIDEWTYNPGPNGFIYYLRFEVGSLVIIRNTGKMGY